jgi:endonuclease/exonuclease/phosphatase family metal-dependent hydrolase
MRKIILLLQFLLILATLLAYLSAITRPSSTWLCYFFGIGFPWLVLFNLFFIGYWIKIRRRYWLYSVVVLVIGLGQITRFWGTSPLASDDKNAFNVLTLNTNSFDYLYKNPNLNKIINDFLSKNEADIVCFQEHCVIDACAQDYLNRLPHFKGFYVAHPVQKPLIIFSRYPILQSGSLNLNTGANEVIFADINLNGEMTRIYSVHLKSNNVSTRTTDLIENKDFDKSARTTSIAVLRAVKNAYLIREKQAEKLHQHILASPYPVIVAGDFNDTPQTYTYSTIAEGLQDTWQAKGFGRGSTYAGAIPFLRIDYILASKKMEVLNCDVIRDGSLSDHYAVKATLTY